MKSKKFGQKYSIRIDRGDENQKSFSGHLTKAVVSATFEGAIEIIEGEVDREKDPETGLNLIKF